MLLSDLVTGEKAYITRILGKSSFRRRMGEMGFVKGKEILVVKNAPLKDPIEYSILGYLVSLRRSDARNIEVTRIADDSNNTISYQHFFENELVKTGDGKKDLNKINVAFVGNPNAGKTTLYNAITHSNEHTGNYSGVTVDIKSATIKKDEFNIQLTDLPGTYSISAFSPEELFVRDYLINEKPDIVVNVVDASNLERNLFFTSQLIDMGLNVVIALNMYDELEKRGDTIDHVNLGKLLGVSIVPTIGSKHRGINELIQKIVQVYRTPEMTRKVRIDYGHDLENAIHVIEGKLKDCVSEVICMWPARFLALRLLQKDRHIESYLINNKTFKEIKASASKEAEHIKTLHGDDVTTLITDSKYGFISGALRQTFISGSKSKIELTEVLDSFLTHKLFGFPIFLAFLWLMFGATFTLGKYPQALLEWGISQLSVLIENVMADGSLKDLLVDGIIGGVGGVIVFLPNILILFLFISFMEDSGYMARVVFIMDKLMRRIGLHGKSFIPLIMGFGCNVPAIMASRTIDDKNSRMITMLINPLMSCSARLPVYLLLIGAVFPSHQGSLLFIIYFSGILLAVGMALIFKRFLFNSNPLPFVLELPPYRVPTVQSVTKHMWFKGSQYLQKMGGVILVASILIWGLSYFPLNKKVPQELTIKKDKLTEQLAQTNVLDSVKRVTIDKELLQINGEISSVELKNSYIGRIGSGLEPIFSPLGFDWKMSVSLLSGIVAKEIVVSTLGVLFQIDVDTQEDETKLAQTIQNAKYKSGKKKGKLIFNPLATLAFMAFTLIYFPCIAVIAAIKKESNSVGWAAFTIFYTSSLAWLLAFVVYQVGSLFVSI